MADRATRRDLRRAMGEQAVEVIAAHSERLLVLESRVDGLAPPLNEHQHQIDSLKRQQGATFNALEEFCNRSILARLRWLLTGR